ncbi:hypothetical protein CB0940_08733 [Cercospora beticola]|uniref:Uncharacterized protein n=2 Tax=Cercospora beticola TaxID=122368 RepID=A0A2G5HP92_CERBT|nr:hypothetical protein CB0940_08733 [Cercospora beticola]PIA94359.1 hypothetical protein CB0940_08733 [Cercospora beticola]CAK1365118.1 unnamed protein product [Cercospora beticola]
MIFYTCRRGTYSTHNVLAMLYRESAAVSGNSSTRTVPQMRRPKDVVAPSSDTARPLSPASVGSASQRGATLASIASEARQDLTDAVAVYGAASNCHHALFCRYLALAERLRDKVAGNMMTTLDSLECVAETLEASATKLNAAEVVHEHPISVLDEGELREVQHDIREAGKAVHYVRARIDRLQKAIERLETANEDRPFQP